MFARLLGPLGLSSPRNDRKHTPLLGARVAPSLPRRLIAQNRALVLTEAEMDHLVDFWARHTPTPLTATIRKRLFLHHLTVTLETHPLYEQVLDHARTSGVPLTRLQNFIPVVITAVDTALSAAQSGNVRKRTETDDRMAIGIPALTAQLDETWQSLADPTHRDLIDYLGTGRLTALMIETLRVISHEYVLARQITETAKLIKQMEGLLSRAALPNEDLYELKLRRDLFVTDLRLYNRLTRQGLGLDHANKPARPLDHAQ